MPSSCDACRKPAPSTDASPHWSTATAPARCRAASRASRRSRSGSRPGAGSRRRPIRGARLGADQRAHHHRLFRGADRAGHAAVSAHLGAAAVPLRPAPVRLPAPWRRAALGDQHALRHQGRREHPDRGVRQVERRHDEDGLPARPRPPLRSGDAGHLRRALQLLVPRALLAGVRRPLRAATTSGRTSAPTATSHCCATTAATAGSSSTSSETRRRSARRSCRAARWTGSRSSCPAASTRRTRRRCA